MGGLKTERLTINDVVQITGGTYGGKDDYVDMVVTDSRQAGAHALFIPIRGEKVNGEKFIPQVYAAGGVSLAGFDYAGEEAVIRVADTLKAYLKLAAGYRDRFHPLVVGVTGSVGKTTTKDLIAFVLERKYKTLKTLGNRNNEIGMPETLLRLDKSHEAAVIEMGMCGFGEIEELTMAAKPDIAIITMIGVSHIELLGSRENICKAKMEIVRGMRPDGLLVLNGEDDMLAKITPERAGVQVQTYGFSSHDDAYATDVVQKGRTMEFCLHHGDKCYDAVIPSIGEHMVLDALGAFLVGVGAGISPEECILGIGEYIPSGMRQNIVSHNGFTVIEDCYNASPDSMKASLTTLHAFPASGKKIAVLADMLELGDHALQAHCQVGQYAAKLSVDALLCTGEFAPVMVSEALNGGCGCAMAFPDKGSLFSSLKDMVCEGDTVLFKASNGMHLEEIIERLYEEC